MAGRKKKAGKPKSGDWKHIVERGGRLYLRLRVPTDVQAHFGGKTHLERSLGTADIAAARREKNRLLPQWEAAFDEARSLPPPVAYRAVLDAYFLNGPTSPEQIRRLKNALRLEAELAEAADEAYLAQAQQSAREWLDSLSDGEVEAMRARALYGHRAPMLAGQRDRPIAEFASSGIVAPEEVLAEIERVEGVPQPSAPEAAAEAGHTIWNAWDIYKEERKPSKKTSHEWKRSLELFEEAMQSVEGAPRSIEEINRDHVWQYVRFLRARPSGRGGGTVSDDTVNKRLAALRSVLEAGARRDWIIRNPASGFIKRDRRAMRLKRRLPLLVSEIETVQAGIEDGSDDYWIYRLLRFTGARLGEIAQLHKRDVKKHRNGIWYLSIHDEGEERHLKNEPSIRNVPLHGAIMNEFCSWVRERPNGPLWPSCWSHTSAGEISTSTDKVSKRLNRRIRTAGITDPRKTLHSLRHAFKDALRHVTPDEELRDAILGHTGAATVGRDYGDGHFLRKLAVTVNAIDPEEIRRLQEDDANPWQTEVEEEADDQEFEEESEAV